MKKTFRILFLLVLISLLCVALCSCNDSPKNTDSEQTSNSFEEETAEVYDGEVKFTYDGSNIRNDIVDYMKSMAHLEWKPNETFFLTADNGSWGVDLTFNKGVKYRGLPYTRGFSDLEKFVGYVEDGVYKGPCGDYQTMPGNNCSSACDLSWRRYLLSEVSSTYTYIPNSCDEALIAVGSYENPEKTHDTKTIIAHNGLEKIYEAYSMCKLADAVVKWGDESWAGHARMVTGEVVIKRNAQGKINPNRSYLVLTDQTNGMKKDEGGLDTTWNVDKQYSFEKLAKEGYVPVTHPVFANGQIEEPYISYTDGNTAKNIKRGLRGVVKSNYAIGSIEATVTDGEGSVVRRHIENVKNGIGELSIRQFSRKLDIASLSSGKYTYKLKVNTMCMGEFELCCFEFEK